MNTAADQTRLDATASDANVLGCTEANSKHGPACIITNACSHVCAPPHACMPFWLAGGKSGKGKNQWPELVGKTADQAKAVLQKEAPEFQIQVIPPDHFATMDYRCERIRIWLNKQQLVSQPPMIG